MSLGFSVLVGLAVLAASCTERVSEPHVDVAPPIIETNVGPLPGVGEGPAEPIANPFANDLTALADGRRFFEQYNCAGCHGDHGGGGMGPSLRDDVWLYGGEFRQVAESIREGRNGVMPAWRERLSEDEQRAIAAWLLSQGHGGGA